MVSMLAVPVLLGSTLYQIVFERPVTSGIRGSCAHGGAGSAVLVVAPELSLVSVKLVELTVIALAKLSFAGAGATTTNVGKVTVEVVTVVPPPGGGFWTPTEFVLPNPAMKLVGIAAVSWVALTKVVASAVPPTSGFMSTLELDEKPVPFTVSVTALASFTGALRGLTGELMVGGPPKTVNGSLLLVVAATTAVT